MGAASADVMKIMGYAAKHSISSLRPMSIERADPKPNEVEIHILFCGVCHSDVHQVKNDWKNTLYPCMPGHEIVGRVRRVGSSVTRHKEGDLVGVGCMVDSCHTCSACNAGLEQYCEVGATATYNGNLREPKPDANTFGGYSESIVVREDFVLKVPSNLDPAAAAPLLCAGVTTYSPLKHWKAGPGVKVGIVGFGGLGQLATKLARALGAEVTVISTSEAKLPDAKNLGAWTTILSTSQEQMKAHERSLDLILSTIPESHDANLYVPLLRREGTYVVIGCLMPLAKPLEMTPMLMDRKSLGSTLIGGIAETQEVLDFCSKHGIVSETKVISIDQVNDAFAEVNKGVPDFRYVIDMASLAGKTEDTSIVSKLGL